MGKKNLTDTDSNPIWTTYSPHHFKPVKCRRPHSYNGETMRSWKAQSLTLPACRRCFMNVWLFWSWVAWLILWEICILSEEHSASEFQQLLISAPPPWDAGLLGDKGPGSHQSCHVAEAHAYLTHTCKGLMLLATEGEKRTSWVLPLLKYSHCIMVYKCFFTSMILFEPYACWYY